MRSTPLRQRLGPVLLVVLAVVLVGALGRWRCAAEQERSNASADEPARARQELGKQKRVEQAKDPLGASVSGIVVARGGSPLAGARVCAIADLVQSRGRAQKPRCVLTDARGQYRIDDLWPVRTRIHASAARHQPAHWRSLGTDGRVQEWLILQAGREHADVDITLEPGGVRLAGVVHDLAGGTVEGAFVTAARDALGEPRDVALALSDADGRFELWVAPGSVRVEGWAAGYSRAKRRYLAPSERVELFLLPESVLVGRVVDASTGEPVSGAEVWAGSHQSFRIPSGPQLNGPLVRSDEHGRFRIGGLEPGMYEPGAVIDDRYGQAPELIHLGLGQTSDAIEIRVHAMARVVGQVRVAETEQPCSEPHVQLRGPDGTRRARVLGDGQVELLGLQPGSYQVSVSCRGFVPEPEYPPLEIADGSPPARVWHVHVGADIRGLVVDARGQPLVGMRVGSFSIGDSLTRAPSATQPTDEAGQFTISGVAPGRYQLRASGPAGTSEALEVEVHGTDEPAKLRLVVPDGGSLRGRVIDSDGQPRAQVELTVERSDDRRANALARSNDLGEFEIAWLEPGPYRVAVVGETEHENVQIRSGEQAQVELVVAVHVGMITGRVYDADGAPVSDAFVGVVVMSDPAEVPLASQRAAALARSNWSTVAEPSLTDVDGRFAIAKLAPGEYIVYAHRKGGGTAVADSVAIGSDVSLQLTVTGSLAGTVALPDGTLPQTFDITLTALDRGFVRRDDFFRTQGVWAFRELPAGRLRVQVEAPEGTATTELTLGDGEARELELVLQPRVTVTGRVVDLDSGEPLAGMSVTISGALGAGLNPDTLSDEQGRFRVTAPSGEITLFIGPKGGTAGSPYENLWAPRSIPADSISHDLGDIGLIARRLGDRERPGDLGFELAVQSAGTEPSSRRAELALVRTGGPAAAAGLAVGDVIEQVDGKSVVGRDLDRFATLTRVPAGTVLSIELADGRTVALTVGAP